MQYKIKDIRLEKNMSQDALAKKASVSRATISNLENGKVIVTTTYTLIQIAHALDKKVSDIFLD